MTFVPRFFAIAAALSFAAAVHAAEPTVERSTMLLLGNVAGHQEARYADDGTVQVHFEFNDRGRGPKTHSTFDHSSCRNPIIEPAALVSTWSSTGK